VVQRRDPYAAPVVAQRRPLRAGTTATVREACEALVQHHLDWKKPTLRDARHYLLGGRLLAYCDHEGIQTIDQLTTERVEQFLGLQASLLKPDTVRKYRTYLRALARFQKKVAGYGDGLADIGRISHPKVPRSKQPKAVSKEEERKVIEACTTKRGRLIVETLFATGVRVSELCALLVDDLYMERQPYLHVRGSIHDRDRTKNGEDRKVPFRSSYSNVSRRPVEYIASERDPEGTSPHREIFLSSLARAGQRRPLTQWGVEQLMQRLAERTGIYCHPHRCRHTWATRCVDAGIPMFHLQQAGGWKDLGTVRRYYSANVAETLDAFARAHEF
jgi:site-specific recombinase XerD